MNQISRSRFLAGFLFLFLLIASPLPVFAAAPPQINLSVSQASPGATIEVLGGHFPEDAQVEFLIQSSGNRIPLGKILADDHGEFSAAVLIPLDTPYDNYEFQAIDDRNQMAKAPIAIVPDTGAQSQDGQRSDEDPLLAPMPTPAVGAPTPMLSSPSTQSSATPEKASLPLAWIALGAGAILVLVVLISRRMKQ